MVGDGPEGFSELLLGLGHRFSCPPARGKAAASARACGCGGRQPSPEEPSEDGRIRLIGQKSGRRYLLIVNGKSHWVRERSFTTLVRLAVALKSDGTGWIKGPDLATYDGYHQVIRRMKEDIGDDGTLIQNDRESNYRLAVPREVVSIDVPAICCCMPESGLPGFLQEMGMLEELAQPPEYLD